MGDVLELEESEFAGYMADNETVRAMVLTVKAVEKPFKDDAGNPVKKVEFKVAIIDPDGPRHGNFLWGDAPVRFNTHPDCRLRNWAQSILGQELVAGYQLDTDVLEDREVLVQVGYKEWDKNDGTVGKRNFIKDIMPTGETAASFGAFGEEPF